MSAGLFVPNAQSVDRDVRSNEPASKRSSIRVVRFYKIDHLGDPVMLKGGCIRLGVQDCKRYLRAGIREPDLVRRDNLIISIGGLTARDGLRDRLAWAGIPVKKNDDGSVDCADGFLLLDAGPTFWRRTFPRIAAYVDTVNQWHRVGRTHLLKGERPSKVSTALCRDFVRLFQWGKVVATESRPLVKRGRTCAPLCAEGGTDSCLRRHVKGC